MGAVARLLVVVADGVEVDALAAVRVVQGCELLLPVVVHVLVVEVALGGLCRAGDRQDQGEGAETGADGGAELHEGKGPFCR